MLPRSFLASTATRLLAAALFLLGTPGLAAQQTASSPQVRAECVVTASAVAPAASAGFRSSVAVGLTSSGELASANVRAVLDVQCVQAGCLADACGDCDRNGRVDILDALLAARHSVGTTTLTGVGFANCDADDNEVVDILDALLLAQTSTGQTVPLSCC